jgi:hypothetical protein
MPNFAAEYARAKGKYPDALWSTLDPRDMLHALQREVDELGVALWKGDLHGEHGILAEKTHVMVVAARIGEEMARRNTG